MNKVHVFIGKGGVGKSTCSSLAAVRSAAEEHRVLLDSMDPAHNLHDIFELKLTHRISKTYQNLHIRESDMNRLSREYMRHVQKDLKGLYHYQQALNIDKYFNLLKYAPGMEEYAALIALQRCYEETGYDAIFIDTPPTALTLKMLALPKVNLHWIEHLIKMRKDIVDKKNSIAHVRKENLEKLGEDPIFRRLDTMQKEYEHLVGMLADADRTEFVLIMNEDELSFAESLLIKRELHAIGLSLHRIIINKSNNSCLWSERIRDAFPECIIEQVAHYGSGVRGQEDLQKFCMQIVHVCA